MGERFWDIPRWSKWDELDQEKHAYLWRRALTDGETGVERLDDGYILYGPEDGLLFRPRNPVLRLGMDLYDKMLRVFHNSDT